MRGVWFGQYMVNAMAIDGHSQRTIYFGEETLALCWSLFRFCRFDIFQDVLAIKTKSPFCFAALFPPPIHSSSHITLVMEKFHAPCIPRGTNALLAACLIEFI